MRSARLTLIVVAVTVAGFPAAVADLVLATPASPHPSRGLGAGMIVIAAVLAVPSILASLLVRRRRRDDWLAPMLALTGFLPSLALLGAVFQCGPRGDYAVSLSQGSWVLLFLAAPLLVLFFPEGHFGGRDRWLAGAIALDAVLFIAVGAMSATHIRAPTRIRRTSSGRSPTGSLSRSWPSRCRASSSCSF